MTLPVTETLKLILNGPSPGHRDSRTADTITLGSRLDALFEALRAGAPEQPADQIEDEIWSIWTSHDDPAVEDRMQRAIAAIARRRFDEADELLDGLVRDAPGWAEVWNKRATLRFLQHRDAESATDIRRALELEPRHFGAICGFGQICLRHGETAAAAGVFAAALELNPHLDSVRAVLAELEPQPPQRLN